jgi:hypothetical protein
MMPVFEEKDLGMKQIIGQLKSLRGSETQIGLWGEGDPKDNLAARATVHEYGSTKMSIPSRPFNRNTFDNRLKEIQKYVTEKYNLILERKINALTALRQIGDWYTGLLKDGITNGSFKSLSPATIARKGSSKPLIDYGDMRNRIAHKEIIV